MCVFVEIDIPGIARGQAGDFSTEATTHGLLELSAQRQPKSEPGSRFLLGPRDHPCACALGANRADGAEGELRFEHSHLPKIEATLRFLLSRAGTAGFWIRCYHVGGTNDRVPRVTTAESTLDELLNKFRNDHIGENVRYHIRGKAA